MQLNLFVDAPVDDDNDSSDSEVGEEDLDEASDGNQDDGYDPFKDFYEEEDDDDEEEEEDDDYLSHEKEDNESEDESDEGNFWLR